MISKIKILLSVPRTVIFNFRYLPLKKAVRLPIWIANNVRIRSLSGKLVLPVKVHTAMIRIGYHIVPIMDDYSAHTIIDIQKDGILLFEGTAHIGQGTKINISERAQLILGDNFSISALSQINCYKLIRFGKNIQFAWDCLVMDSDTHFIYNEESKICNQDKEIVLEDKIWIGCRATILKGSYIASNCVVGANSVVSGKFADTNQIIAGNPAKVIRRISGWEL